MRILFSLGLLALSLFAELVNINPKTLQEKIDENIVVIDIRTPPEWKELGVIPTSKKLMFFDQRGNYNVEAWVNEFTKYVKDKDQPFVLVCRSGNRTGMVGNFLSQKLGYKNVYHLEHGIKSWIRDNRKTVKN